MWGWVDGLIDIMTSPTVTMKQRAAFVAVVLLAAGIIFGHAWVLRGIRRDLTKTMTDLARLESRFKKSRKLETKRHESLKMLISKALGLPGVVAAEGAPPTKAG